MPITSINRVRSIRVPLTDVSVDDMVTLYQNSDLVIGSQLIPGYTVVSFNTFIKNLKVFTSIESLPEALLPNFTLEDSETDKVYKTLDIEWKSPRKQLNLYISNDADWLQVGSISMLNPAGYPFRVYNLLDLFTDNLALELGENSRIGVQVQNVGFGLLDAADKVTIHGSYVEEIFVDSPAETNYINIPVIIPPITINVTGSTGVGQPSVRDSLMSNNASMDNNFLMSN